MKEITENPPQQGSHNFIFVGPSGGGKTSAALMFPNVYVADCDNNLAGPVARLKGLYPQKKVWYDVVELSDAGKPIDITLCWQRLLKCVEDAAKDPRVGTIVVDSLTKVVDYLLSHIAQIEGRKNNILAKQDWNMFYWKLRDFLSILCNFPKTFILITHETKEKDEADGFFKYEFYVPGKIGAILNTMFGSVWRFYVDETAGGHKYMVRAMPSVQFEKCKGTLGLPATFEMEWDKVSKMLATAGMKMEETR